MPMEKKEGKSKRFALFMGNQYYPRGGWEDFIAAFDTVDEAMLQAAKDLHQFTYCWANIADLQTGKIVRHGDDYDFKGEIKWEEGE